MLNPDDPKPPYLQIADDIRAQIHGGSLEPGQQLPPTGKLASDYGVARMTVGRALTLLGKEGLVVSRQGSGVFVRTDIQEVSDPVTLEDIADRLAEVSEVVSVLGQRVEQLEQLLRSK